MKSQGILLLLSGAAASYVLLALAAGPKTKSAATLLTDPVPEAQAETTGTRLSAKLLVGTDGWQRYEPEVLHDTTLDVDCSFHKAADGVIRCLPVIEYPGRTLKWVYSDDQCQNQAVFVGPRVDGCDALVPKYVHTNLSTPFCGDIEKELGMHLFQVGAPLGAPSPFYVKNLQGTCVEGDGGSIAQDSIAYAIGAEVPASTFVEGTLGLD